MFENASTRPCSFLLSVLGLAWEAALKKTKGIDMLLMVERGIKGTFRLWL